MRLISAALLGAAVVLPALAHAVALMADPADAAAVVPTTAVPSAFDGYRPYSDSDNPSWQQLNQAVRSKPSMHGMTHEGGAQPPAVPHLNHSNHSKRGATTP
ncbi:hypothetical protein AB1286_19075 [Trinickia sp. NRRL B-1857]|uniref:hypothetical protein n=1 Tax=Trinickia sp. NRRL B-1857 TaxID=3162879 RepID=UPI003D270157